MLTIIGEIATTGGLLHHYDAARNLEPSWLPAIGYLKSQPASVPLLIDHDEGWQVGTLGHLERSKTQGLIGMGRVRDDLADVLSDGPWFFSSHVRCLEIAPRHNERALLSELSLVRKPASCGARPVHWANSDTCIAPSGLPLYWFRTWDRGQERMNRARYHRERRLEIEDVDPLDPIDQLITDPSTVWAGGTNLSPAQRAMLAPPPPPPRRIRQAPPGPEVRLDGQLLDPRRARLWLELVEAEVDLGDVRRIIRSA